MASVTRAAWLPQTLTNIQFASAGFQFENWLRIKFRDNMPADEVVRRLLTVPFTVNAQNPQFRFVQAIQNDPDAQTLVGFYQANEAKAENLGAAVSRLFLGVKLECAQCHDHPFAPYTKEQFWEFAAFFAELNPLPANRPGFVGPIQPQSDKNRITIPNTEKMVVARFFDGTDPNWSADRTPAAGTGRLADQREEPVLREEPRQPHVGALLRRTASSTRSTNRARTTSRATPNCSTNSARRSPTAKFDNRVLIRGITRSQAYQLVEQDDAPDARPTRGGSPG